MDVIYIVLIIVGSISLLVIVFLIIYFAYIRRRKLKKLIEKLNSEHVHLNAILNTKESNFVKRLGEICKSNKKYLNVYGEFLNRLKNLRDKRDITMSKEIQNLFDMFDDHSFNEIKKEYLITKDNFQLFEKDVLKINKELEEIFKSETELRTQIGDLKEKISGLKNEFNSNQENFKMILDIFEKVFLSLEKGIKYLEKNLQNAEYENVQEFIPKMLEYCDKEKELLNELSPICECAGRTIPAHIEQLSVRQKELTEQGYPLQLIFNKNSISELKNDLQKIIKKIRNFNIKNINIDIDSINKKIDDYNIGLNKEIESKRIFEKDYSSIYEKEKILENSFVKLCNNIIKIKSIYVISEEFENKRNEMQKDINVLILKRRSLDMFIHSKIKQPFTLIVEKMNEVNNDNLKIEEELILFHNYINSLKEKTEDAYELVFEFYYDFLVRTYGKFIIFGILM